MNSLVKRAGYYLFDIARGRVSNVSLVHKFGRNSGVPNGSFEGVLQASAQFYWPQAATTVRVKAGGNAADDGTSSPLGAGARSVTVSGIDVNGQAATETLTTAGGSASASTTTEFWRVNRAWVAETGTYTAANTAAIMIEDTAGANDMITIVAEEGQTQFAAFTVPINKRGYLLSAYAYADATKAADFALYTRNNITDVTAPMSAKRLKHYWDGVLGSVRIQPHSPMLTLAPLTDIWIEAQGGGALTEVSAGFEVALVDV